MKTNILNIIAFLIFAGSFPSCGEKGYGRFHDIDANVDSEIHIRMAEIYDISPRTLQLYCSTTTIYPCSNYPIYVVSKQSSNTIDISFKGVIATDFCLTAIGPATAIIDLGTLSNGRYRLNLYNGAIKQSGELIVSRDSYMINFAKKNAFHFTNARLNRIPEN